MKTTTESKCVCRDETGTQRSPGPPRAGERPFSRERVILTRGGTNNVASTAANTTLAQAASTPMMPAVASSTASMGTEFRGDASRRNT